MEKQINLSNRLRTIDKNGECTITVKYNPRVNARKNTVPVKRIKVNPAFFRDDNGRLLKNHIVIGKLLDIKADECAIEIDIMS